MSQKLKVELQDENGNIYYLHTAADVVYLDDGTTVETALEKKVTASGGDISNTKLATLAASSASFPVPAAGDAPKTLWGKVKKWQQDCLAKFANYVLTSAITNQYLNDTSKIPTAALMYLLKQEVNGLNSELEIKQLSQGQTILDFALENADNRVAGFIVQGVYPEDGPENSEFFVHIYRDESFSRLLVKLTPYGRTAYVYERTIFQGNWQNDTWRKLSYTQILLSGIAATDSQGYATVTFSTPLDVVPRIFLQWISDDDMIFSFAKAMNISKTGFKIRILKLDGTEIVANAQASAAWIAVAES